MDEATIRPARRIDAPVIVRMITELARFERLEDQVRITAADVERDGFDEPRRFECLIAERHGEAVGFALYYFNYSTFLGHHGLALEDIYVAPDHRRGGLGQAMMERLAAVAVERGCPRLDLEALHWNPARAFYERLGFEAQSEWRPYRLSGRALAALARGEPHDPGEE